MNASRSSVLSSVIFVLVATLTASSAQAGFVSYFDGEFNNADWSVQLFQHGNGGTSLGTQVVLGGNLGSFRQVINTVNGAPSGSDFSNVYAFHRNKNAIYDPATQGKILSINFFLDTILLQGFGDGQASGPALIQDGTVYLRNAFTGPEFLWASKAANGLDVGSFSVFEQPILHPDFSENGAPIQFGFLTANSTSEGAIGYSIIEGYDNWKVDITNLDLPTEPNPPGGHVVPLPPAAWTGIAMLAGMATHRLIKSRKSTNAM